MKNKLIKHPGSQRGVIMVIAALIFTLVLAMAGVAVDLGIAFYRGSNLQTAADAAAFAAATKLPVKVADSSAQNTIKALVSEHVLKNGDTGDQVEAVEFEDSFVDDKDGALYTSVRVRLKRDVKFFFGPIVGINGSSVRKHAKVRVEAVIGGQKIAPLGISWAKREATMPAAVGISFAPGSDDVYNGFFGYLDLNGGGGGASEFENNFKNGYDGDITFGTSGEKLTEYIESQNGVMAGPAEKSFNFRYNGCTHTPACTPTSFVTSCPRIVIIVVYELVTTKPPHEYRPLGIAPYFLNSYDKGTKILTVTPVKMRVQTGKTTLLTDLNYNFGLLRARLVE